MLGTCTTFYVNMAKAYPNRPHTHVCWGRGTLWRNVTIYLDTLTIEALDGPVSFDELRWAMKMVCAVRDTLIEWYFEQKALVEKRVNLQGSRAHRPPVGL